MAVALQEAQLIGASFPKANAARGTAAARGYLFGANGVRGQEAATEILSCAQNDGR
jgi:hypothetical protein